MNASNSTRPQKALRWRGPENRAYTRWPCAESTFFSANQQLYDGKFKDMSAGGTFIQARGRFQIGEAVIVAGVLARDGKEQKRIGKIVRIENNGIAIQFTDGPPRATVR
ncbi:MAG: PilZ domain-containing protein [Desulfobacterales bacterium]|jgi:Tfp pilus assembly protein PilZ